MSFIKSNYFELRPRVQSIRSHSKYFPTHYLFIISIRIYVFSMASMLEFANFPISIEPIPDRVGPFSDHQRPGKQQNAKVTDIAEGLTGNRVRTK